jgi:serine protease Do
VISLDRATQIQHERVVHYKHPFRRSMNRRRGVACGALIVFLALVSPVTGQILDVPPGGVPTLAPLVREVTPAVVNISVHGKVRQDNPLYKDPFFREFFDIPKHVEQEVSASGSGVIVDAQRGYVLTANHVVDTITTAQITTKDGRKFSAKLVGRDSATDIAVMQILTSAISKQYRWATATGWRSVTL